MNNYFQVTTYSTVALSLLLTACGGGSNETEPSEVSNRAPQAVAGMSKTALAQSSVILDARQSSDQDGDTLSYQWIQSSGPAVVLSNPTSNQPSFVAPEVDAATELVFELQVTDANQDVASDNVTITVQTQPVELQAKQLKVIPVNTALSAADGKVIDIAFQYEHPTDSPSPTGLMLKLHWDSSRLSFKEFSEVLAVNHLGVSASMPDSRDDDNNPDTDQYVILSWLDYENVQWPADVSLPAPLFAASFEPVTGASGSTHVTVSPHFNSPGYTLLSQSVSVEL